MSTHRIFVVSIFSLLSLQWADGKELVTSDNLKPMWKVLVDNKFEYYKEQPTKTIHFTLDLAQTKGRKLKIESYTILYLFINNSFIKHGTRFLLDGDSLKRKYSNTIFISIYQPEGIGNLETSWVTPINEEWLNPKRSPQSFSNFILIAALVLIIFFTSLFRTNPQLTLDYLNFSKLFFLRDREENQITLRITSSVNLLFYLFCSLLASLVLVIASHYSNDGLSFFTRSTTATTIQSVVQWFLMALSILGLLMIKFVVASLLATLYNWKDVAGFQFFNFVRVLMLSLAVMALVSIVCFSLDISINYFYLLKGGCLLLALGIVLLFFKLLSRTSFRSFHLFSYLCATEIFPLMILIKFLLF